MKTWSMGKIIAVFVATFVLVIVAGIVILKLTNRSKASAPVVTSRHRPDPPTAAPPTPQPSPQPQAAYPPVGPAPTPATAAALGTDPPPAGPVPPPPAATQPELHLRLAALATKLDEINARLAALEAQRPKAPNQTAAHRPRPVLAAQVNAKPRRKPPSRTAMTTNMAPAAEQTASDAQTSPSEPRHEPQPLPGYKSLAIVSNRAWLTNPDGTETSVTLDEPLPQPRVRSMNPDTGVIVTTTQQRVSPR